MDFGFENIMDFAMNIDKEVMEVMEKIVSYAENYRREEALSDLTLASLATNVKMLKCLCILQIS